jgi:intracellular sulfur oxidation DsrE/DsrF family protein
MSPHRQDDQSRREFLGRLSVITAASATNLSVPTLREHSADKWDMSWLDKLASAKYKAVFDSTALADGAALDLAAGIWNDFAEVYGSGDGACMVVVMRQLGQVMAFNDAMWAKYEIGLERKVNDPVTKSPATRNPFATSQTTDPAWQLDSRLDALHKRGAIFLVCNRASMNWANSASERTKRPVDEVRADIRQNLVPGAFLMPTGVFALVRAQNAGCAFMRGS